MHWRWGILGLTLILSACEKVIDIPLVDAERKIVVEAVLKDLLGESYVKISKTGSVYDDSGFDKISGATVIIKDEGGTAYTFSEVEPGIYKHPTFTTFPYSTYYLELQAEGETITASSQTSYDPVLDSIVARKEYNFLSGYLDNVADSVWSLNYYYSEPGGEKNYYVRKGWQNGIQRYSAAFDDSYTNGTHVEAGVSGIEPEDGDYIKIELAGVDYANYEYQNTLNENVSVTTSPANPLSNLQGNALGYFGAFCVDTLSILIPN